MNYQRIYDQLMDRARTRKLEGYSEKHHLLPRCIGGNDEPENLRRLTAREHFVAHELLVKLYPDNYDLKYAVGKMSHNRRYNSRKIDWVRRLHSEAISHNMKGKPSTFKGKKHTEEAKAEQSRKAYLRPPPSSETRKKLSIASSKQKETGGPNLGRTFTDETKKRQSASRNEFIAKVGVSESTCKKLSKIRTEYWAAERVHRLIAKSYLIDF